MEYDEKKNLLNSGNNSENVKSSLRGYFKSRNNLNYVLAMILIILFIIFVIFYNVTLYSTIDFSSDRRKEIFFINETEISDLTVIKPNSYKEKITHFKLQNEVEVVLMSQKSKKNQKDSIGLIVGSGAMNDDKIEGLAHFTEHMLFLGSQKYSNETFFNDYITSNEGHFNGFTDKDTTTFIFEINRNKFLESLDVFLNFFVKPLFKSEYLEKEIFAVNSEFEKNIHSDEKRFDRLYQSMSNPAHPFNKFSTGNKKTLKADGISHHSLREKVIKYFHKHYIGKNIKIVAYTNHELENVKNIILNNMIKIHNHSGLSVKEKFLQKMKNKNNGEGIEIYTQAQKGKIIFYKSRYKTMKIFFFLKDMKKDLERNPKMFFKILFSMKYKNSFLDNLIRERLIFNYSVDFKDKYNDVSAIYFKFLLTENGLKNLEKIIKILSEFLHLTHENISNQKLFNQIKEINNKNFLNRKPIKSPYTSMKKLTKNFYLFGKNNFISGDNLLKDYNHPILHEFIKNMTLSNSQIYVGARSFKNFNKTYLYKILHHQEEDIQQENSSIIKNHYENLTNMFNLKNENERNSNKSIHSSNNSNSIYSENEFLDQKEKYYKTKYKVFNLNDDNIWHIFKRETNGTILEYPDFSIPKEKKKILKKTSLCYEKNKNTKLSNAECQKLYIGDRRIMNPLFIHQTSNTEIYLKTDRMHLDKSFIINMKIIPNENVFNLKSNKNVVLMKLLIIYLNFMYSEIKIKNNNFYDYQNQVFFTDNYSKKIPIFLWRNSKEKLSPNDFSIDGLYMKIKSKSYEIFEQSEVLKNIKKIIESKINKNDFIYLKEELFRYIEFYKSSNPTHQAYNWLYRLGFKYDINYLNMTSIINKIKMNEFNDFKHNFFNSTLSNLKILMLGVGAIEENKLLEYTNKIEDTIIGRQDNVSKNHTEKIENKKEFLIFDKTDELNKKHNIISKKEKFNPTITKHHKEKESNKDVIYIIDKVKSNNNIHHTISNKKTNVISINSNIQKFNTTNIHQSFLKPPHSKYGNKYIYQVKNIYKHSPDSSTLNVYFLGENNIYNQANMRMINLIAGNIFFSYLRIKLQLGYSVKNKLININNNLFFTIYVQGSKKYPSTVHKHIEKVIYKIKNKIQVLDEITFEKMKSTVMEQMTYVSYNLDQKNNLYWSHLLGNDYIFPKKKVHLYMNELKTYDLEKFIDKLLEYRISLQVFNFWSSNPIVDKESIYLDDLDHFRKSGEFIDSHTITDEISKPKAGFKPDEKFRLKK